MAEIGVDTMIKANLTQFANDPTYIAHETVVQEFWKMIDLFHLLQEWQKEFDQVFDFTDGPPFVTGSLHMGHILVSSIKSSVLNIKRMMGYKSRDYPGLDCHGLPMEGAAQKELDIKTNAEIEELGIAKFNSTCKDIVAKYSKSWIPVFDMIGRWGNFDKPYKTMDANFMESVWWVFGQLWKKDLIYRGYKVMPYSYGCFTPLSNFEMAQGYKEKTTKSLYVFFPLKNDPNTGLVAWTTTPWTLPSNVALCVNSELDYIFCIDDTGRRYIVGASGKKNLEVGKSELKIEKIVKGAELVGIEYEPLFTYIPFTYHKVVADPYVMDASGIGTSIVHIAPSFGEDDFRICVDNGIVTTKDIGALCPVNDEGKFTDIITDYKGINVFEADPLITKDLKMRKQVLRIQEYKHQYPYCWRTDTPLIYRAVTSYFVAVTKIKDEMIRLNDTISWYPDHIGKAKFRQWLFNAKDWCISRFRYFGTCIPVWISDDGSESLCISSIDELMEYAKLSERPTDLHREFMDAIEIVSPKSGKVLKRVNDILDCWIESGSVPYGQCHYPFENADIFENKEFLSDFIAEGVDQTRGWFYTLLVLSTALMNKAPFKSVMCTGLIMDENGRKFSKRHGNFVDPCITIQKYGADVTRLYLLSSPAVRADVLNFNEEYLLKLKQRMIPYINAVKFFIEHTLNYQSKGYEFSVDAYSSTTHVLDNWILMKTSMLVKFVQDRMKQYQIERIVQRLIDFVEDLTNWYVKLNRDRLKGFYGKSEWTMSLSVLHKVIYDYTLICAPFVPFLSEYVYQHIRPLSRDTIISVHLHRYPEYIVTNTESDKESNMVAFDNIRKIVQMVRSIRTSSKSHPSVKIPLKSVTIFHNNDNDLTYIKELTRFVHDDINALEYSFVKLSNNVEYKLKPDNRAIGIRFKSLAKRVVTELSKLDTRSLVSYMENPDNGLTIDIDGVSYQLDKTEISVMIVPSKQYTNENVKTMIDGEIMVAIDLTYDRSVNDIGEIRKIITAVQNMRKRSELRPWNKIQVFYNSDSNVVVSMIEANRDLIFSKLNANFVNSDPDREVLTEELLSVQLFNGPNENLKLSIVVLE